MAFCHIRCYQMLHATREAMGYSDTMVGFANHLRVFEPENPKNPVQAATARAVEWLFQGAITQAMSTGVFRLPLKNHWKLPKGEYCDFHGVNYYTRSTVTGFADGVRKNSPRNDLGWEIYPDGLPQVAAKLEKLLKRPIWSRKRHLRQSGCLPRPVYLRAPARHAPFRPAVRAVLSLVLLRQL